MEVNSLKLQLKTGCILHNVSINDKDVVYMPLEQAKKYTLQILNNLNDITNRGYSVDTSLLIDCASCVMDYCENTKVVHDIKYGDEEDEIFIVAILTTNGHRIRSVYDCVVQDIYMSYDMNMCDELSFNTAKNMLIDIVNEFFSYSTCKDDESMVYVINSFLSDIVQSIGHIVDVSDPCGCCGDVVYTYELDV